jgi:hypothetical protein
VRLGRSVRVDVTVSSQGSTPTGAVTLVDASGTRATATLVEGRATLTVPSARLGVGSHNLKVRYAGDASRAASEDAVGVVVTPATSSTRAKSRTVKAGRKAVVKVRVAAAVEAAGMVKVSVRKAGRVVATRTVTLAKGAGKAVLPRLKAGRYRITATYSGSPSVAASKGTTALRVTGARR